MVVRRRGAATHALVVVAIFVTLTTVMAVPAQAQPAIPSGSVARWGDYFGGAHASVTTPHAVSGLANVVAIDASNSSNYALECVGGTTDCPTDGVVMAWGDSAFGALGNGRTQTPQNRVVQVQFPPGVNIVAIGEARSEGFAIDSTGQGWAWGNNGHGSLCIGSNGTQRSPVEIPGLTNVKTVQGGQDHVLWLLSNGTMEACGVNNYGQLGTGTTKASNVPVAVKGLSHVVQITAGNTTSGAIDNAGNVYMWGYNRRGQTGVGTTKAFVATPTKVTLPLPAVQLSAGGDIVSNGHSLVILSDSSVYAWGDDANGELGDGTTANEFTPVQVSVPTGTTFTNVAAGGSFSLALDTQGNVYAWGGGKRGLLGAGNLRQSAVPVQVDTGVALISATANDSLDLHQ